MAESGAAVDSLTAVATAAPGSLATIEDPAPGGGEARTISFAGLERAAVRLATGLLGHGAEPDDRLVWCGPNSPEILTVVHAARKAGLVAVPLSYRFTGAEMHHVLSNSGARVVVVDAEQAPQIAGLLPELPDVDDVVVFGGEPPDGCRPWDDVLEAAPEAELPGAATEAGATMIYTSGTTGKPKGAVRTRTDRDIVLAMLDQLGLLEADHVHLTTGPLYHSGPLAFALLSHTMGRSVVVMRHFDAREWLRLVARHRVTNTFSAPTQLKRIVSLPDDVLAAADLSSMRCLIANAAPVPYSLKQEIAAKLGIGFLYEVYGSTELGVTTILQPEDQLRKPGSCGRPYGSIEVRIVGDDGREAPVGEPGELFIRTGLAIDAYHRTDAQLASHGAAHEGWRSVGDLAYVDEEGYVHICDRRTDLIISGGMNVYPAEVEAVLHEHPAVLDVAVIGIPDDEWGERVHAVVQPRPGKRVDIHGLDAFARGRLAGFKRPRSFEVREELPRTESGKLLKRLLRAEHRPAPEPGP